MPVRSLIIWGVVAIVLVVLFATLQGPNDTEKGAIEVAYSDLLIRADEGRVESVRTAQSMVTFQERGRAGTYVAFVPEGAMADTVRRLHEKGVRIHTQRPRGGPTVGDILLGILPMLLLIGAWFFFMRQMQQSRSSGDGPTGPR